MSHTYYVHPRGALSPAWSIQAPSRKSALDRIAALTAIPRHKLMAEYVDANAHRPRFPEDDE